MNETLRRVPLTGLKFLRRKDNKVLDIHNIDFSSSTKIAVFCYHEEPTSSALVGYEYPLEGEFVR